MNNRTTENAVISETATETVSSEKNAKKKVLTPEEGVKHRKKLALRYTVITACVLLSGWLRALSVHCFVIPHNFAPGGVTGIATLLQIKTGINSGIFLMAINAPLLIASFFLITKRFAIISTCSIALQSGLLLLFEHLEVPVYADNAILAAIAGGIVGGAGIGILLKVGGSSGGTDIIATFVYRRFSAASVGWFIFIFDSVVVFISFFVLGSNLTPVLLALAEIFSSTQTNELVVYGFKSALKFEIITSSAEALSKEIMEKIHRGVTVLEATGAYTGAHKNVLICVIRRSQLSSFQKILARYPDAFAYISKTNDVIGRGFMSDLL